MFVSEGCFLKSINVFPSTPPGLGCLCFLLLGFCTFPTLGEASKIHTESPFSERGLVSPPLLPRGAGDAVVCLAASSDVMNRLPRVLTLYTRLAKVSWSKYLLDSCYI